MHAVENLKEIVMKVCMADRSAIYQVLKHTFAQLSVQPYVSEVGVLRGDNAINIYNAMNPAYMWLIDKWKAVERFHYPFSERPFYIEPESNHDGYFGGPLNEQATFDRIFNIVKDKFSNHENVKIIAEDSIGGLQALKTDLTSMNKDNIDYLYIDADHEYEYVLRDLMYYHSLISPNGVIQLNDCCFSPAGAAQNLGVLPAVTEFLKRTDFCPVLLTNTDWSDLVLVRKNSTVLNVIDRIVNMSNISYVEVPPQLLPAMKVIYGAQRVNVSFL